MKYKSFEELPVWKAAVELAVRTCEWTGSERFRNRAGLRDQIERAALSVSNNIAEGFDRGTHGELISFLYIALGSCAEVRSMTHVAEQLMRSEEDQSAIHLLRRLSVGVSRQLGAWLESLKDSPERGPRHRNSVTRSTSQAAERSEAFRAKLTKIVEDARQPQRSDPDPS